ncbi:MAG: CRISPR-associated helicase Cas3' [Allosphingosinicella sp.]
MHGIPDRAWGKLLRSDSKLAPVIWHPLVDHCADVSAIIEALLRQPLMSRRLCRLGGLKHLDDRMIQRLGAIAFLHDIGKANRGFQNKRLLPPGTRAAHGIEIAGNVRELYPLLCDESEVDLRSQLFDTLPVADLCAWVEDDAVQPLLVAAVSHHGTPWNTQDPHRCRHLWLPGPDGYDPFATLRELAACLRRWFPAAFDTGGVLLPDSAPFQHAFAGLVMLADWLGSHTGFFPFSEPDDADRMAFARGRALESLAAVGLAVDSKRTVLLGASPSFDRLFPFSPNAMQLAAGQLTDSRLVILEAETGSGKTEAALWRFKQLFEAGEVNGLYFALPTRIAATQIYTRVRNAVARLWPKWEDRPAVLLAVPGYVKIDDAEVRKVLPGFEVLWTDDPDEAEAHKRWAGENPKRFLAAQIAVGTIDQALLADLMVRHAHLRAAALLRHLLVVDEVHASDPYMTALLQSLLQMHLDAGGHALLMSATLGSAARRAYLLGPRAAHPDLLRAIAAPYPCLSSAEDGSERQVAFGGSGREKRVLIRQRLAISDAAGLAREALAAARAGAKVLVVRNTVGAAVATQQALEALIAAEGDRADDSALLFRCEGVPTLHHGRFAREDRKLLDAAVEARLGRERGRGGAIVVGTQTLEQSLDIDADLLITDLCPMDVLLQRIGRLHRHVRDRPAGFLEPLCVVATPAERDLTPFIRHRRHGLGSVYPDLRVVEATWRLLETHPEITGRARPVQGRLFGTAPRPAARLPAAGSSARSCRASAGSSRTRRSRSTGGSSVGSSSPRIAPKRSPKKPACIARFYYSAEAAADKEGAHT